ncbi:phosphatidylserine decarboxylase-related protein [Gigaspora rosea]|uniref:Phosphatidylserine decarboxylase-related protein n=1 Tax=Gigaspora rosea TaxID=44941 RepID=A0A397VXQ3_9GLOM|nr:phosphatidylserine decarboxylase-related protein [Gigaspora rosea]CAG8663246.1 16075_t:CDS:1 [Gigaspora rosea]
MPSQALGPFPTPATYHPMVQGLMNMIKRNKWEDQFVKAVSDAYNSGVEETTYIKTLPDFYDYLHYFLTWVPREDDTGNLVHNMMSIMYFVLDQESVKSLQSPIQPSSYPNQPLTELSQWIVYFSFALGQFLNTPESLTEESLRSFYNTESYSMNLYEAPREGWHSFNDFFARKLLPGARPIESPDNPAVIVSPADSTFNGSWDISNSSIVVLKDLPWTIGELLANSQYKDDFAGGTFMHSFLVPYNYHRVHTPIEGKVLEAIVIPGQTYCDVTIKKDSRGKKTLKPSRKFLRTDEIDIPDPPGYQFCQTRGLIIIDSPKIGKVAVLPVGMAHVSSVVLSTKAGAELRKGDEISYFQFGGSDVCILFQKQSQVELLAKDGVFYPMGKQIAICHTAVQESQRNKNM